MKKNHQIFEHLPLLNFQLIFEKQAKSNIDSTNLKILVDTDEDDLNRTLMDITLESPHVYDFSLKFEGFESFTGTSEHEKIISGKVFLVGKINNLAKRLPNNNASTVQDKIIELAAPKLRVLPIKVATPKSPAVWASPVDISRQIKSNWYDVFSSALSGYLVQSYNLLNAKSIAEAVEASNEQSRIFSTSSNTNNIASQKEDSPKSSILGNMSVKQKKIVYAIGGYIAVLSFIIAASLVKSVFFSTPSVNQAQLANNNFQIPTNVMSVEEAKKAQLRELGINPDDLAADLGCFVEEN